MGLLRSEEMKYGLLVLPVQDARRYIEKIGKETAIQFEDMNAREMRRPYRKHIQRIDEMERILRFMLEEIGKLDGCTITKNKLDEFMATDSSYKLDEVEGELQQLYSSFVKFKENNMNLVAEKNQAVEEKEVISAALQILGGSAGSGVGDIDALRRPMLEDDALGGRRLGYVSGVVMKTDEQRFARALWRTSRGNVFVQFSPIREKVIDPKTAQVVDKSVFVIYFQGVEGAMKDKIVKVCTAFGVNLYSWPGNMETARQREKALARQLSDKEQALEAYQRFLNNEARDLVNPSPGNRDGNSKIEDWRLFCVKEKAIYNVLNMCEEGMILRVNVWYPASDEDRIRGVLKDESKKSPDSSGAVLNSDRAPKSSTPPTYIRTNEYTEAWQEVVDTYGICRYQEANPALFACVTFPFIFGMMYGDVGHGTLLLLAGAWLVKNSESLRYTQPTLCMARYMVLSLGIFATFAGFMYNDFFSVGLQLFESGFVDKDGDGVYTPIYDVKNEGGPGPYPFGLDWAWVGASNELLFVNSMKMKLSVLFGVLQMIVGLLLRWSNAIYDKNMTDFIFECIPMMIFMLCFFGWMDVMILYKWTHPIDNAPNIINSLICMAMGQQDDNPLWPGSVELAQTLMKYTVISVPLMLFPKPFILLWQHKQAEKKKVSLEGHRLLEDEETGHHGGGGHGHGEEFEFGEIFIHQIIETIEYVLGTVSHTASYLRIWALSLAHQQLSLVFFQKTLTMGLEMSFPANGIMLYFMFAAWFGITLGVLLGMDVLECFLHTLRLHWVEFQSKFYKAGGEKFAPFDVRKMLLDSTAE
mmetsp:Transcript_72750/g.151907  ORF Transcript_72750/g.151907 Transcript_72750/m.151907 type:complete len:811 (-) Transcript_72750:188-2620(-)|eukprot:CAMPEP_0206466674 /NCGR_PEP_ID=MMETSP0324_2-20121206/28596_1 /ASSEMBLY_ACC=CAM_ASM_000836 /TAXON_ID=2866 /ORGANISM="Crypthecodinium cohnii, Strain Seligo" /LENGTH=810 /DNA_ID=CAMNT_0053939829 /DNA_START=84 /DNA_END=2516 /DNA_ORIENTATION=+